MIEDALQEAIQAFPISSWLGKHTKVYSNDYGKVVYADCPICGGKKKLGVYRYNRVATCGRCRDGGHNKGLWRGSAGLPTFVKLLEGCSWRETFRLIHELSGLPEPKWEPSDRKQSVPEMPDECVDLDERALQLLYQRHVGHLRGVARLAIGGRYHERIVLPCYFKDTYLGFEAKATYPSQQPKSLYAPNMATDSTVYTIRAWNPGCAWAAVTESVLDAETFHGIGNAVGCFGGFKAGQLMSLLELDVDSLYWFLDGDAWGTVKKGITRTASFFKNYVVPIPLTDDPNSVGPDGCEALLSQARLVRDDLDLIEFAMQTGRSVA